MSRGTIAILRAQEEGGELAEMIRASGYDVLAEPILSIEYLPADYGGVAKDAPLVFTSAHGVRAFAKGSEGRGHPVYTVGSNTAEAARGEGFAEVKNAAGTVDDLVKLLKNEDKKALLGLIYPRGEDISRDLKEILTKSGISLREIISYRANPAQNLSIKLLHALDRREIKAVVVFSARGGRAFADLIEQYGRAVRLNTVMALCISEHVLQSVSVLPFGRSLVAEQPDRYGMMKLVENISIN